MRTAVSQFTVITLFRLKLSTRLLAVRGGATKAKRRCAMARKKAKSKEPEMASHVIGAHILIPKEGDEVGLVLNLEDGSEGKALLRWDGAKTLAETALGACQVLEERAKESGDKLKENYFNATSISIEPGFRPDEACITIHAGDGRIRFLIDLDLFMQEMARVIKEIEASAILSNKLH